MRTLAVLPVKSFGRAKQRLGAAGGGIERASWPRRWSGDVLDALRRGARARRRDRGVGGAASTRRRRCARSCTIPVEAGQSAAAAARRPGRGRRGARSGCCSCPGDCPALDPGEVDELLASAEPGVVIVPDRHGSGTNALLIDPPTVHRRPPSAPAPSPATRRSPHAAGATVRVGRLPSLELDVDTPGDLDALRAALARRPRRRAADARAARAAARSAAVRLDAAARPAGGPARRRPRRAARRRRRAAGAAARPGRRPRGRPQGRLEGRGPRARAGRHRALRARPRARRRARQGPAPRPGDPRRDAPSCCAPTAAA